MWLHSLNKHLYITSGSIKVHFISFHDYFSGLTNKYITIVKVIVSEYCSKSKRIKQISQLVQSSELIMTYHEHESVHYV